MKNFVLYSILVLTSVNLMAQAREPKTPFPETPFSVDVKDKVTGDDLGRGNWAFDVNIRNENSKPLHCLNTTFLAYLDDFSKHCPKGNFGDYGVYLNAAENGQSTLDIPANASIKIRLKGYDERVAKEKETGLSMEFCGRESWDLKCGFNCPNDRVFGENWNEPLSGGSRKRTCDSTGTAVTVPGTFSCEPGFDRDETNEKCIPKLCDNRYSVGTKVQFDLFDGARNSVTSGTYKAECLTSGFFGNLIPGSVSCKIDYYLNSSASLCIHKSESPNWNLGNSMPSCNGPGMATSQDCLTGTIRWCSKNGYGNTGISQQYGSTGFAALCFDASHIELTNAKTIQPLFQDPPNSSFFRSSLVKYCTEKYGTSMGLVHELGLNGDMIISCTAASTFVFDSFQPLAAFHSECSRWGTEASPSCNAATQQFCSSKGLSGGYVSGYLGQPGKVYVHCVGGGNYRLIEYAAQ